MFDSDLVKAPCCFPGREACSPLGFQGLVIRERKAVGRLLGRVTERYERIRAEHADAEQGAGDTGLGKWVSSPGVNRRPSF